MSLALYRKYRPSIFADVIGQEHVTVLYPMLWNLVAFIMHIYSPVLVDAEKLRALASWPARLIAKKAQLPIHVESASPVLI